jgi:hypothetical protein
MKLLYCSIGRHCEKMLCRWMLCGITVAVEWLPLFKKRSLTITDRHTNGNLRPSQFSDSRPPRHAEHQRVVNQYYSTTLGRMKHCPHIWSRSKIFCTVITLLSSFMNNYLNVKYFSMISHDTKLMVIHEWYYHCCSQLIILCDYYTNTITDWVLKSMYLWFWQSYQVSQAQPICVNNIDAHSWITG